MINALETNFFYYQSDPSNFPYYSLFLLELENNRFQKLVALEEATHRKSATPTTPLQRPLYGTVNQTTRGGMMNMNFPSISEAFSKGDGMSFGHLAKIDSDQPSLGLYDNTISSIATHPSNSNIFCSCIE